MLGELSYDIAVDLLRAANVNKKLKYLNYIVKKFKILAEDQRKGFNKEIHRLNEIRNSFAHAMVEVPQIDDYKNLTRITF